MMSLRYHVISIAAVFLAVAVGVVLGSTALSGALLSGLSGEKDDLARQVSELNAERSHLRSQLADADGFAAVVGPLVVRDQLTQRTVALISTPDVRQADRDAMRALVSHAGGQVTADLRLTEAFTDPAQSDRLRDVVVRLLPAGIRLPSASDPGTLSGGLIGPLVLINKDTNQPQASQQETDAALAGLAEGGFLRASENLRPAQVAIVLDGGSAERGRPGGGSSVQALRTTGDRAATVARFAIQVDRAGAGAVLAGGTGSADGSGPIGVVRADGSASGALSTVDNVDRGAGRVATVLALREQLDGRAESYGSAVNARAVAPGATPGR